MTIPNFGSLKLADIDKITAQKQLSVSGATEAKLNWDRVVATVRPLLEAHPDWTFSDAVEHIRHAGGARDSASQMPAASDRSGTCC